MMLSRCLLLFLLLLTGAITGWAEAVKNFEIDEFGDTAYAPYSLEVFLESDNGVSTKPISKRLAVLRKYQAGSEFGELIFARNPALNIDNPAIFSHLYYPNRQIIDDDPVRLIIGAWELFKNQDGEEPIIYGAGYRCDSAFVFRLFLLSDSIDYRYLTDGRDGTGDNRWDPQITLLAMDDYDLDGRLELFFYVNSMREAGPRKLFCIDVANLAIEWSLPVAATLNRDDFFCLPDSVDPRVAFSSYNPKQRATDSIFSDLYAYMTIVDSRGRIKFNKILAWHHGGVYLRLDRSIGRFYVTHETDFLPVDSADTIGSEIYHVSALATDGTREKTVDVPQRIIDAWLGPLEDVDHSCLFLRLQDGTLNIYDSSLALIASNQGGRLSSFLGKVLLPGMADSALVHRDAIYDKNYHELLRFNRGGGQSKS